MKRLLLLLAFLFTLTSPAYAGDYSLRPLGAHPSPITATVQQDTAVDEDFPAEYTVPLLPGVLDQSKYGMCVAYSLRAVLDMQALADGDYHAHSAAFIYGNRDDNEYSGEGMHPYSALRHLQADGTCLDSEFPNRGTFPALHALLTDAMRGSAADHKIDSYTLLPYTASVDEIKSSIYHNGALTFMIPVYSEFYIPGYDGILPMPDTNPSPLGYHEMTICGWRVINGAEYWRVLNSWGDDWGVGGYCFMPLNYPIVEYWEVDVKAKPLPEPEPLIPQVVISEIDFTLTVEAENVGSPVFQWWLKDLQGNWYCVRDYVPDATITLSDLPAGDYEAVVYVKEAAASWQTAKYQVLENRLYLH